MVLRSVSICIEGVLTVIENQRDTIIPNHMYSDIHCFSLKCNLDSAINQNLSRLLFYVESVTTPSKI